jgi:hypothetical protein
MNIEFSKEEMISFLHKRQYRFKEIIIQWNKVVIAYPEEIPWENFSAIKKEKDLLLWKLENTFIRELKHKLLSES